ncbi:MAG: hypothetical protein ACOC5F_02335 [Candidatus Aminicenantaceae bacterium]
MASGKTIEVTPNIEKCMEVLKDAIESLPQEKKEAAKRAIQYLDDTFQGKAQPMGGRGCLQGTLYIDMGG